MADAHGIDGSELLYRKVSVNSGWYDPIRDELKPDAFRPRSDDENGISFDRAKSDSHPEFRTLEAAAQGASSNGYYIAVFRAGDLVANGFSLAPDPTDDNVNSGHSLVTDLTYNNRTNVESQNKMVLLAHKLKLRVEGPFRS